MVDHSAKRAKTESSAATIRVAFLGSPGSYCQNAASNYFAKKGKDARMIDSTTYADACNKVDAGDADFAVLPFENSTSGVIHDMFCMLIEDKLSVIGECTSDEEHCLCALKGTKVADVRNVMSHPHILDQCSKFLRETREKCNEEVVHVMYRDSASACKKIYSEGLKATAAIASKEAAAINNLEVIQHGIGNSDKNETRYLILAKKDPSHRLATLTQSYLNFTRKLKCSIAVSLADGVNALYRIVSCFAQRNLNIIKVASSSSSSFPDWVPASGKVRHWDYLFFIEFEPSYSQATNENLMTNLQEFCASVHEFGVYEQNLVSAVGSPRDEHRAVSYC